MWHTETQDRVASTQKRDLCRITTVFTEKRAPGRSEHCLHMQTTEPP